LLPTGSHNIAPSTAFNTFASIPKIAPYISYLIPIFYLTIRKLENRHPQYGPYKLGRYGFPINLLDLVYILYTLTFLPFLTIITVTASNLNYARPLVAAIILIALCDWPISGRKRFDVPISLAAEEDS
jgi:hypothetical protein